MKFLEHKGFTQKIIIAILCVTLFNFITPNYMCLVSKAEDTEGSTESTEADDEFDGIGSFFAEGGGILLSPFVALISFFADTVASGMQSFMMGNFEAVMTPLIDHYAETDVNDPAKANVRIKKGYGITTMYPNFTYSCEEIFANKVPMLDINFLNPSVTNLGETEVDKDKNVAAHLQSIIKAWYRVLRMIAIIGLLSVLIYMGIRIMIDSNLDNKAKYKQRLLDWIVAFVILFSMQYIMSFTLAMSEELTDLFTGDNEETRNIVVHYEPAVVTSGFFKTNLIGLARFKVQNDNVFSKLTYLAVYIALLVFTIKFTFVYLKRVMHMAFLTLISPIIALMYPIDKIQDNTAQGFQTWLREYIFNALLQPFHYLLYTILVSSSVSLAASNPLYAIVALLFMTQAEKFLKKIFGFDKAGGGMVGGMSAFATGAIASTFVSSMKKGGIFGKEHGPQASGDLAKSRMPTMKKDTDVDGLPIGGYMGSPETPETPEQRIAREQEEMAERQRAMEVEQIMREQQERERQEQNERNQRQMEQQQRTMQENQEDLEQQVEDTVQQDRPNGEQSQGVEMPLAVVPPSSSSDNPPPQSSQPTTPPPQNPPPPQGDPPQTPPINPPPQGDTNQNGDNNNSGRTNDNNEGNNTNRRRESFNLANSVRPTRPAPDKAAGRKKIKQHIMKPFWDSDLSTKDNLKRWGKRYVKAGMGLTTLAAYTGATLTDGKITPAEEVAAFAAGYKGGGIAFDNIDKTKDNYVNAYRAGAYGVDEAAAMAYKSQWDQNKEVNKFYQDNYKDDYKEYKKIASEELLTRGVKDLDEQKQCFKYADAISEEKYKEWENNEKEVIRQEHQDYNEGQVQREFNRRKEVQAQEVREALGKDGRKLTDDQAIHRAMMADATKEAATVIKFRKKAENKGALMSPDKKKAFINQQVKALRAKPENNGKTDEQLQAYVNNAFNKVDIFDALNDI